jgi:hypothetical protein
MRAVFASKTLGTALVKLPSGRCYGRILPPHDDTPSDHLRVDLAGVVHLVPAPFAVRVPSADECAPVGVVPAGANTPGLTGEQLGEGDHGGDQSGEQQVHHGR